MNSKIVKVGKLLIGNDNPIIIQSMTNTDTMDTDQSVEQIIRLYNCGCQLVRLTASDQNSANNLYFIKNELIKRGYDIPLVADIHFLPKAALIAAQYVEKIRINPGNYVDKNSWDTSSSDKDYQNILNKAKDNLMPLVDICKKHNTAIRIGVNHGSLSKRILYSYGNTPMAMAQSAMEYLKMFSDLDFDQIVVSLKASDVRIMFEANQILTSLMKKQNCVYPIHLGVTEAGNGLTARIKSICGIGSLLKENIGDTIRVSLTEKPENEIPIGYEIANICSKRKTITSLNKDNLLSTNDIEYISDNAHKLLTKQIDSLSENNVWDKDILQSLSIKRYMAEFVACPTCGRTKYDVAKALEQVKKEFSHLKEIKIAVMGCIVNGPGEIQDADYGYIGCGEGKVNLYKANQLVVKAIDEKKAIEQLKQIIKQDGKWYEV